MDNPHPLGEPPQFRQPIPTEDLEDRSVLKMFANIFNSFYYAFDGLLYVLLTQRNMRFHFFAALGVMSTSIVLNLSPIEKAFLFIVISFVFSMEVLNTCIEAFTDIVSPSYHRLAKVAKDTAAAAVLAVSIGSIMAACYLLLPRIIGAAMQPHFFSTVAKDLFAIGVVMASIVVFWIFRALRFLQVPALFICSVTSAFSIAFVCYAGRDIITFFATLFFSHLLLASISKKMAPLAILIGQIVGILAYGVVLFAF
jgi:diacylglycerol kinase (ATP)